MFRLFDITLDRILALMSINVSSGREKYEILYVYAFTTATVLFAGDGMYVLLRTDSFIAALDLIFLLITAFGFLIAFWWTRRYRRYLLDIHRMCTVAIDTTIRQHRQFERKVNQAVRYLCYVWFWGTLSVCLYSLLVAAFTKAELGSPSTLLIPVRVPWRIDTPFRYCLMVGFQIATIPISMVICCAFACFSLYCFVMFRTRYDALTVAIRDIDRVVGSEDEALLMLRTVQIRYRFFALFADRMITCVTPHFHFSLLIFFFSLVNVTAILILVESNIMYELKMLNIEILACIPFVLQSYIADEIFRMKHGVMLELYQTNWYARSIRYRKQMVLFMTFNQIPFRVKLCGLYTLNFQFVTTLLRYCYSAQQFLLKVNH